jgi:GTP-binding protein HflX
VVGKLKSPDFDQPILISDTIGFINNLPPVLIDSFKSTLLESLEAKLLLHVVDSSDPQVLEKIEIVEEILQSLQTTQPRILVLNKVDLVTPDKLNEIETAVQELYTNLNAENNTQSTLLTIQTVSAQTGEHIEVLKEKINTFFK